VCAADIEAYVHVVRHGCGVPHRICSLCESFPSGAVAFLSLTVTPSLSVVPQSNNQARAGSPTYLGEGEDEGVCVC
jgi:hypothetical protein